MMYAIFIVSPSDSVRLGLLMCPQPRYFDHNSLSTIRRYAFRNATFVSWL